MLISLMSAKGAPGVTTTALALAVEWPPARTAVVIEADPAGGDIAAGLGHGASPGPATLSGLAGQIRHTSVETALRQLVYRPAEHAPLTLAGVTRLGQAAALPWDQFAAGMREITDADLLCDGGRYQPREGIEPLLQGSDHLVLVTRSSLPAVRATQRLVEVLRWDVAVGAPVSVLVIDPDRPYGAAEIAEYCGAVLLGELPLDPGGAAVWSGARQAGRGWRRSPLQRAARAVADGLAQLGTTAPENRTSDSAGRGDSGGGGGGR